MIARRATSCRAFEPAPRGHKGISIPGDPLARRACRKELLCPADPFSGVAGAEIAYRQARLLPGAWKMGQKGGV